MEKDAVEGKGPPNGQPNALKPPQGGYRDPRGLKPVKKVKLKANKTW
jgi:hypothetical protein